MLGTSGYNHHVTGRDGLVDATDLCKARAGGEVEDLVDCVDLGREDISLSFAKDVDVGWGMGDGKTESKIWQPGW